MQIKKLNINEVTEHPRNVRIHTKKNLQALKTSLSQFGQLKPIIVQKSTMYVIAGNGTLQAARALGWQQIECNIWDIDDNRANAFAILDNKTTDLSNWDQKGLLDMLQELGSDEINMLDLTGFQTQDLQSMLKFQSGQMFEQKPKKQKKQKKKKEQDYSNQLSFVLLGFPYVNDDKQQIMQIKHLTDFLKEADKQIQQDVTKHIFDAIEQILNNQFMR